MLDHARRPPAATGPATSIPQHERERQHEHDYARVSSHTRRRAVRLSTGNSFIYIYNRTKILIKFQYWAEFVNLLVFLQNNKIILQP